MTELHENGNWMTEDQRSAAHAADNSVGVEQEAQTTRRTVDPELRLMDKLLAILQDLGATAQDRCLMWLIDRCVAERRIRAPLSPAQGNAHAEDRPPAAPGVPRRGSL